MRDYDPLIGRIGEARLLLGEASHGTNEFYCARAEITKRLITEKNSIAVAVETIRVVNAALHGRPDEGRRRSGSRFRPRARAWRGSSGFLAGWPRTSIRSWLGGG